MKIKVTEERECCQPRDLKPVEGSQKKGLEPLYMFCIHCGHRHVLDWRRDPAGGTDSYYRKLKEDLNALV